MEAWGEAAEDLNSVARVQVAGGALRRGAQGTWLFGQAAPYRVRRFGGPSFADHDEIVEDHDIVPPPTDEALMRPLDNGATAFLWWHDRISGILALPDDAFMTVVTRYYEGDSL